MAKKKLTAKDYELSEYDAKRDGKGAHKVEGSKADKAADKKALAKMNAGKVSAKKRKK